MDIDAILKWFEGTAVATRIREGLYLFPMLESIHVIGLALVFGTILVIDLRLLGKASAERPFKFMSADILKWTWVAFAITAITGSLMFTTNAGVYYHNFYFQTKMVLLALAGINMFAFELTAGRTLHTWDKAPSAPPMGRFVGVMSIVLWIAIIVTGRFIGFTTSRAAKEVPPPAEVNFDDLFQPGPADSGKAPAAPPRTK
jgi:hypothetical protein